MDKSLQHRRLLGRRPPQPTPTSPPERARKARGAGLSAGCSEKNKLIETKWQLRQREPPAHAVEGAFHYAETSMRISQAQAQAAARSSSLQAIEAHLEIRIPKSVINTLWATTTAS